MVAIELTRQGPSSICGHFRPISVHGRTEAITKGVVNPTWQAHHQALRAELQNQNLRPRSFVALSAAVQLRSSAEIDHCISVSQISVRSLFLL
jgi:hypothetical protein